MQGGQWSAALDAAGIKLAADPAIGNLVDQVWGDHQPPMPNGTVAVQPLEVSGASAAEKLEIVRVKLSDKVQCSLAADWNSEESVPF